MLCPERAWAFLQGGPISVGAPLPFLTLTTHRRQLTGAAAGTGLVVCTQGAGGATAVSAEGVVHVPAPPVPEVVDTNGAGDTHTGALLAEVAAGTPWVEGCRRANAAAAARINCSPRTDWASGRGNRSAPCPRAWRRPCNCLAPWSTSPG